MMQRTRTMIGLLAVLFVALPASLAAPPSDAELIAKVEEIAAEALKRPGAVGLSIAVGRGESVILEQGFGLADVEHQVEADGETAFRIGSVTKQFTAAAVMRLVEQGKLSLEDPLEKYFPDYPRQGHAITLRHLLNHTSGIYSYTRVREIMDKHVSHDMAVDELLSWVKDEPFDFTPGEGYRYNNTAYYMLGPIIEQASGVPYCQYLQDELFTPLGLARTRCDSNGDLITNRARGYRMDEGTLANARLIGMENPGAAGMMIATAGDLVRWTHALMGGEVVSAESLTLMTTPTVLPDGTDTKYGFGLRMDDFEGHRRISHGGGIFGFNSMLEHFPDDDLTVAVISNCEGLPSVRVIQSIVRSALGIEIAIPDRALSPAEIERFRGHYAFEGIATEVDVFAREGHLYMQATRQGPVRLYYQGEGEFRAEFDPDVKVIFDISTEDGPCPALQLFQGGAIRFARRTDEP